MNEASSDGSATVKNAISVNTLFSGKKQYEIPKFQRNYEWTTEQLEQFWSDLTTAGDQAVFLGPATWTVEKMPNEIWRYLVIDGQQRLTTIQVLLSLIRVFADRQLEGFSFTKTRPDGTIEKSLAEDITRNILNAGDKNNVEDFFLKGNEKNQAFLRNWIFRNPKDDSWKPFTSFSTSKKERREIARLYNAAKFFNDKLEQIYVQHNRDNSETGRAMHALVESLRKMEILPMEVNNESEAYALFESLNDRGLSLTLSDLLKSHLLRRAVDTPDLTVDEVGQRWAEAENQASAPMKDVLTYLMLGEPGSTTPKDFYNSFKKMVETKSLEVVLSKIENASESYGLIHAPEKNAENNELTAVQKSFMALNLAGIKSVRIFLLAALNLDLNDYEQQDLIRSIENYSFRWRLTKGHEQAFKDKMIEWAKEINQAIKEGKAHDEIAQDLISAITRHTVPDNNFVDGPTNQITSDPHNDVVRALLFRAEWYFRTGGTEVNYKEVQIEHIAPEGGKDDWYEALGIAADVAAETVEDPTQRNEILKDRYSQVVNSWGNKTLLHGPHNAQAKDHSWVEKCDGFEYKRKANSRKKTRFVGYRNSDFKLTEDLADSEIKEWTQHEIQDRTDWLFTVASQLWGPEWRQIENEQRLGKFSVWRHSNRRRI